MASEKRIDLIDRGELGIGKANPLAFDKIEYAYGWNSAIEIIQKAPTVDAVEVVRCGECASHEKEACPKGTVWCKTMCRYMKLDGFCSEGKRSVEG